MTSGKNRLHRETSPYLLAHADDPVDWYPWGPEAFERAARENRPLFISIGYSACHWCHVMHDESFRDEEVASLLNDNFICVKVDREERPDVDAAFMYITHLMTGSGGWPLTVVTTPGKLPFYASTYIPKHSRLGRPGLMEIIPEIRDIWEIKQDEVVKSAAAVAGALKKMKSKSAGGELTIDGLWDLMERAYDLFSSEFDEENGGFGQAPKFPMPSAIFFLLRYAKDWSGSLRMVEKTLQAMRRGGVFDQIGFGFHRYSTDSRWRLPHFEKMLYDQALLSMVYTEAYQLTGRPDFKSTAVMILDYVLGSLRREGGGFSISEDADSRGEEGGYYLWTIREILETLNDEEARYLTMMYGIEEEGNFIDPLENRKNGKNVLYMNMTPEEIGDASGVDPERVRRQVEYANEKLKGARKRRPHPGRDSKMLTDWNALMVVALAEAYTAMDVGPYLDAARETMELILENRKPGGLLHLGHPGKIKAFADDYAFTIRAAIALYEATREMRYLKIASDLNEEFIDNFWDRKGGGFYFTASSGEDVIFKNRIIQDGATPSANSMAVWNLLRLAKYTDKPHLEKMVFKMVGSMIGDLERNPSESPFLLGSLTFLLDSFEFIIVGGDARSRKAMAAVIGRRFIPNKIIVSFEDESGLEDFCGWARVYKAKGGGPTAYMCRMGICEKPAGNPEEFELLLKTACGREGEE